MNAEAELFHAFREWRRLAEAEGKAIQQRNWRLLADCQLAIRDFQTVVSRLTPTARAEWSRAGSDLAQKEKALQLFMGELLVITQRNQSLLQSARTTARQRLDQLGEIGRNLKRLQRTYGFAAAPA